MIYTPLARCVNSDSTFVEYAPPVAHIAYFALYVKFCTSKKPTVFAVGFSFFYEFVVSILLNNLNMRERINASAMNRVRKEKR